MLRALAGARGDAAARADPRLGRAQRPAERARKTAHGVRAAEDGHMSETPTDPDDLDALANLPPEDPRVLALGPRTRAQLREYRDFVAPGDAPAGSRAGEAERRLGEALERALGVTL